MQARQTGRFQFTLGRMFLATFCFAVACAAIALLIRVGDKGVPFSGSQYHAHMAIAVLCPFLCCIGIGSGIGAIFNKTEAGGILGFFIAPLFFVLLPFMYPVVY